MFVPQVARFLVSCDVSFDEEFTSTLAYDPTVKRTPGYIHDPSIPQHRVGLLVSYLSQPDDLDDPDAPWGLFHVTPPENPPDGLENEDALSWEPLTPPTLPSTRQRVELLALMAPRPNRENGEVDRSCLFRSAVPKWHWTMPLARLRIQLPSLRCRFVIVCRKLRRGAGLLEEREVDLVDLYARS